MKTKLIYTLIFIVLAYSFVRAGNTSQINNVRITNVGASQFTVSWISLNEEIGAVKYGKSSISSNEWLIAYDERGMNTQDDIHYVNVPNLSKNTAYWFKIISDGIDYLSDNEYFSIQTGPVLNPLIDICLPSGSINVSNKADQYNDFIVYVTILGEESKHSASGSMIVSSQTKGHWIMDISNLRTWDNMENYPNSCNGGTILVESQGGSLGNQSMISSVNGDEELNPIVVGKYQCSAIKSCENNVLINWKALDSDTEDYNIHNMIGFNVLRSLSFDDEFIKINDDLIPVSNSFSVAQSYSYIDQQTSCDEQYLYKIEEVYEKDIRIVYNAFYSKWYSSLDNIIIALQMMVGTEFSDTVSLKYMDNNCNNTIEISDIITALNGL